jgi:enolase
VSPHADRHSRGPRSGPGAPVDDAVRRAHAPNQIEDGLGEDDEDGWRLLTDRLGERVKLVGDDSFVTDPDRIRRAAEAGIATAALIKPNQIESTNSDLP